MKPKLKRTALLVLGLLFSVLPVTAAVLSYFPFWLRRGTGATISGIALILLLLSALPLWKFMKKQFASPSVWMLWLIIFLLFYCLSKIADEITVIAFIGFLTNCIGALFFKLARNEKNEVK